MGTSAVGGHVSFPFSYEARFLAKCLNESLDQCVDWLAACWCLLNVPASFHFIVSPARVFVFILFFKSCHS